MPHPRHPTPPDLDAGDRLRRAVHVVLDNLVVNVALPSIHRDLGASMQTLEWTVNAYVLTYAVLLLTGAALGDRFGRRRMFIFGIALFTVGSAAAALSPTPAS